MPEGLNFVIVANVQDAVQGLSKLQNQVAAFGGGVQRFIPQSEKAFQSLGSSMSKFPTVANSVGSGFKNLANQILSTQLGFVGVSGAAILLGNELLNVINGTYKIVSANKLLAESQIKASQSTKDEAVELSILYGVAKNTSLSYGERQAAIDKMNKSYPDLIKNINLENIGSLQVAASIGLVIQQMAKKAQLKLLVDEIAGLSNEADKLQRISGAGFFNKKIKGEIETLTDRINKLTQSAIELQSVAIGSSFKNLGGIAGKGGEAPEKEIKVPKIKINKVDKLVWKDFINWDDSPEIPKEQLYKDISESGERSAAIFKDAFEQRLTKDEPIDFGLISKLSEKTFEFKGFKGLTEAQLQAANTAETIANTLTPSLDAMVQAIGRGENAFQAFGEGVKAILSQVITKLISTAILSAALSAILPGGGGGFGAIFTKLLGFGGGKAAGGPVGSGTAYVVGEKGPEIFVPNVSGSIIPNNSVSGFSSGSGSSGGRRRDIIRGQNIILAYARTNRSNSRLG